VGRGCKPVKAPDGLILFRGVKNVDEVRRPGWHPIEVRVKGRRVDVRARRGYSR